MTSVNPDNKLGDKASEPVLPLLSSITFIISEWLIVFCARV